MARSGHSLALSPNQCPPWAPLPGYVEREMTRERLLRMVVRALWMVWGTGGGALIEHGAQTIQIGLLHSGVGLCQSIQTV